MSKVELSEEASAQQPIQRHIPSSASAKYDTPGNSPLFFFIFLNRLMIRICDIAKMIGRKTRSTFKTSFIEIIPSQFTNVIVLFSTFYFRNSSYAYLIVGSTN